jgi:hypothetical protein
MILKAKVRSDGHVLGPSLLPVDVAGLDVAGSYNPQEALWLSMAITHSALFHATLYVAALHRELVTNEPILTTRSHPRGPPVPASIFHKLETIKLLNASPISKMQTDDATIGVMLILAASEVRNIRRHSCGSILTFEKCYCRL